MNKKLILPALLALIALAACDSEATSEANAAVTTDSTLAEALEQSPDMSGLMAAIEEAGLTGIFSAPGGYTLIAPPNAAFAELSGEGDEAVPPAVVAAMLREHMLPGQFDLDAIRRAIADNGGKVSVATLGTGMIDFAMESDDVVATHSDGGKKVRLTGSSIQANNGALVLVEAALTQPPAQAQ